jgi:sugar fermentation stimulation protein A
VIFTAQRIDTKTLRPSDVHDPAFAAAARTAASKGVRFMALRIEPKPDAYVIHEVIPVELTPYDTTGPLGWMQANRQAAAPI